MKEGGDSYDFGARIYDPRIGRFLSVDPLTKNYSSNAPYQFGGNNPIYFIDKEGKENVTYLVILPSALAVLSKADINEIVEQANANYALLGLKTRVVLFDEKNNGGKPLNSKFLDKTDNVAIIGEVSQIKAYAKLAHLKANDLDDWEGGNQNPERSENEDNDKASHLGGSIVGIDANALKGFSKQAKTDIKTAAGFLIAHGSGHSAGWGHPNKLLLPEIEHGIPPANSLMSDGQTVMDKIDAGGSLMDFVKTSKNDFLKSRFEKKFGSKPSKANYQEKSVNAK